MGPPPAYLSLKLSYFHRSAQKRRWFYTSLILINKVFCSTALNLPEVPNGVHIYLGRLT